MFFFFFFLSSKEVENVAFFESDFKAFIFGTYFMGLIAPGISFREMMAWMLSW